MQIKQNKLLFEAFENNVENNYQKLIDSAPVGMYVIQDGIFCYCNAKFAQIIGYEIDEIIYKMGIKDLAFSVDWLKVEESFMSILNSDFESAYESLRIIRKDKSIIVADIYRAKTTLNGRIAVIGTLIDVTEEKNSSEQLNILAHAIKSAGECVMITDLDHRIIYVNETLCKTFGYTSDELLGKYIGIFYENCVEPSEFQKIIKLTYETGWHGEILSRRKDESIFPTLLSTTLVRDKNNNPFALVGFSQDISKRQKITEDLNKSERKIRTLIEKMPDGLVYLKMICDDNGQPADFEIVQVNDSFKKFMNIKNEDIIGRTVSSQFHGFHDINFNFIERFGAVCMKRSEEKMNVYSKMMDKHYSISAYSPEENHIVAIIKDITSKRKVEEEIVKSKQMLRSILDNIPQRVFWKDKNSVFQGCNIHFAKDLGFENVDDIIGKTDFDVDYENMAEEFISCDRYVMDNDDPLTIDSEKHYRSDGTPFWIRLNKVPLKDRSNNIFGIVGTYEDISKHRVIEDKVRKLSQAVEQSPASIIITDLDGNIEYVNPKFTLVTGYTFEEIKGKNPRILKSGYMSKQAYEKMWKCIKSGQEWVGEFHNKKKNGELYWEHASISPIKDAEGLITHYLAVKEDITSKKNSEAELRTAKEKAEEMNRLKSIFLANISHELRTPLIGIIGYAETLSSEIDNPEFKEMAKTLLKSGKRLKETLGLILDLSHLEADQSDINLSRQNLTEIVREKLKGFHSAAEEKGLKLQMILGDEDLEINADEKMLSEVLEHLLTNSIKYTAKGEVTVSIAKVLKANKNFAEIKVKDTGIGISSQSVQLIFEPFRQASEGFSRAFEGIGLGLTIAKKYITLMGGEISVESEVDHGSEFTIRFPLCAQLISTSSKNLSDATVKIKKADLKYHFSAEVLLIEDDEPTATILGLYLGETCKLEWASNGKAAIEMASKKNYAAILVDINLGHDMNGIETVNFIKQSPEYKSIPIVAVTAYAMHGDREKFMNLGFADYLSKPFEKKEIINVVNKILGSK